VLQEIVKTGLIYGLAWQKIMWREEWKKLKKIQPSELPATEQTFPYAVGEDWRLVFDDPDAESCDPFDMIYDPYAGSKVESCEYIIHRTWRTTDYIKRQVEMKRWRNCGDMAAIEALGGKHYN